MRTRVPLLAAVVALAVLAGAITSAWAFFFTEAEQPQTLSAAVPSAFAELRSGSGPACDGYAKRLGGTACAADGADAALKVHLGEDRDWRAGGQPERLEQVFTVHARTPVRINVPDAGPLRATLAGAGNDLAAGEVRAVHLAVDATGLDEGVHRATQTVRLTFPDGSTLRHEVPVRFAVAAAPAPPAPRPVEHALAFFTEATETDAALDGTYAVQAAPPGAPVASATRDAVAVDLGKDAFATAPARRFTRAFTFVVPGTAGDATAIALTKGTNVEATVRPVGQAAAGTAALVAPAGSRVQVDLALDPAVAAMERNARLDTTVKLALAGRVVTVPVTLQKKG